MLLVLQFVQAVASEQMSVSIVHSGWLLSRSSGRLVQLVGCCLDQVGRLPRIDGLVDWLQLKVVVWDPEWKIVCVSGGYENPQKRHQILCH